MVAPSTPVEGITLFFPVYNDANTIRRVTEKSLDVLTRLTKNFEIIIINDGSSDGSAALADGLAHEMPHVRVIHHSENLGYGIAIRRGLQEAKFEWVCFTDGDDEYDVYDLIKLYDLRDFYDLIITFRYVKLYSGFRQFISAVYNVTLRWLFRTPYRDISTGLRMIRKSLADKLVLEATSPFIGAEITIKAMLKGYRVGEMGIQTFPREFGRSNSTTFRNIMATIRDMWKAYTTIFSKDYDRSKDRAA